MSALTETIQATAADAYVELYRLDASRYGQGWLYFTPEVNADGSAVSFGGVPYFHVDMRAEGFELNGGGQVPTPTLHVSNVNTVFNNLVNEHDDLIGCPVVRIRTFRKFLDGQPGADGSAHLPLDVFQIERKVDQNKTSVKFELSAAIDQEGSKLPRGQCFRDICTAYYRYWTGSAFDYSNATCPYTGSVYRNYMGEPCTAAEDNCGKRLSDCKARFGQNAVLPYRGFPGMTRARI